jgi:Na+-driven multidrug efflux pump
MGFAGLMLTFFPQEIAKDLLLMDDSRLITFLLQMIGAMYFALGMLNWMSKNSLIGGIYNRPIAIANMTHFLMVGITLAKLMLSTEQTRFPSWVILILYLGFAFAFVFILFKSPETIESDKD